MADFAIDLGAPFLGAAEAAVIEYADDLAAAPLIAPPNLWWKGWTREKNGARLKTRFYFPIQAPELREWRGSAEYEGLGRKFTTVQRRKWFIGVKADADKIAEMDFEAFSRAPETIAKIVGSWPGRRFGKLISDAHTYTDWTGSLFFATTEVKKVNPSKPNIAPDWLNAYENSDLTPDNIIRACVNLQSRRGYDGRPLNFTGTHLWLPTALWEKGHDLTVVQQLVPTTLAGVSGGGNTNVVFGRVQPVLVPDMRSDMWVIAEAPPEPMFSPFAYVTGGAGDAIEARETVADKRVPPHIEIIYRLRDDNMYKDTGQLAVGEIIREGHGLLTAHCLVANYTGTKNASYTI